MSARHDHTAEPEPTTAQGDADLVYTAEQDVSDDYDGSDNFDGWPFGPIDHEAVVPLMTAALEPTYGPCDAYDIAFDVADDDWASAKVDGKRGLHFHPRLVTGWKVLHELAHSLHPFDGHGPDFRYRLVRFVYVFDQRAGDRLVEAFAERGVPASDGWCYGDPPLARLCAVLVQPASDRIDR